MACTGAGRIAESPFASAFAQAVRGWEWQPEAVAKLRACCRALVRVELRCPRSGAGLPGAEAPFDQRIAAWAAPLVGGVQGAGDPVGAGTLLRYARTLDRVVRPADQADIDRAIGLLADADAAHRASAEVLRVIHGQWLAERKKGSGGGWLAAHQAELLAAADVPVIANDALAQDTLRLMELRARWHGAYNEHESAVLQQVADDTRLAAASPLRQVALLRLASLAASQGHRDEAQALFARTGLGEDQCALIGDIPRMRKSGSDADFPIDALNMGFEGWVREEYDVAADGRTAGPRAVIAYPPFVFVDAANAMARRFRYDPSFRPSGKLACSAKDETIKFQIPANH